MLRCHVRCQEAKIRVKGSSRRTPTCASQCLLCIEQTGLNHIRYVQKDLYGGPTTRLSCCVPQSEPLVGYKNTPFQGRRGTLSLAYRDEMAVVGQRQRRGIIFWHVTAFFPARVTPESNVGIAHLKSTSNMKSSHTSEVMSIPVLTERDLVL